MMGLFLEFGCSLFELVVIERNCFGVANHTKKSTPVLPLCHLDR